MVWSGRSNSITLDIMSTCFGGGCCRVERRLSTVLLAEALTPRVLRLLTTVGINYSELTQ